MTLSETSSLVINNTQVPAVYLHYRIFLLIWIHSKQGWAATKRHGVTRKNEEKDEKQIGKLIREREPKDYTYLLTLDIKPSGETFPCATPTPVFLPSH